MLCVLVNTGFQVLFHSPPGVLFTFPSQYCSAIGHQVVFRLGGWAPRLLTGFLVPARIPDTAGCSSVSPTRFSLSLISLPMPFRYDTSIASVVQNPFTIAGSGLASFAFARHYSQNLV